MKYIYNVYNSCKQASEVVPNNQVNNGDTTATTLVTITVRDVNDNAPTFSESDNYQASVLENMQQDVPLTFTGDTTLMKIVDIDQVLDT